MNKNRTPSQAIATALAVFSGSLVLMTASPPARAGLWDKLFGGEKAAAQPEQGRRQWNLSDYTAIRLVPKEPGSAANEHPVRIEPEALRQQLASIRTGDAAASPTLFASGELGDLIEPLSDAFANAGPGDDVLLLSSARRSGLLDPPTAITARLFVQGGRLQLIVNDTRYSFMNELRGGKIEPQFTYGSRSRSSVGAVLRSNVAEQKRADWLLLATAQGGAVQAPAAARAAQPMPATPPAPAAAPPPAAAAPVAPAAPLRPRDPGFADEVEQRLLTLKRLRDRGLITEEEYQQKRTEILKTL